MSMDISKGIFWEKGVTLVPGCTKVSAGCLNCWSEALGKRLPTHPNREHCDIGGHFTGQVGWRLDLLKKALKGKKEKVLAVWNDFYHAGITLWQRDEAINLIMESSKTAIICTKRPYEAVAYWSGRAAASQCEPYIARLKSRIFHLVTVENQEMARTRIPDALQIPGNVGLLLEPLLGPVDISSYIPSPDGFVASENGPVHIDDGAQYIHACILGAESGPNRRPMEIEWAESIVAQCREAGIPVFVKALSIGGKVEKDINKFPESLRVRELPWR